jgi:hypothetical protein
MGVGVGVLKLPFSELAVRKVDVHAGHMHFILIYRLTNVNQ